MEAGAAVEVGDKVPGLAVVVATAEQTVHSAGFGVADVASGVSMEPETICNWFSLTKLATATVAMQLADTGQLDLDAPVCAYHDALRITRPESRLRAVTVRHLLSHSSGLANPLPTRWVHLPTELGPDQSQLVRRLLRKHRRLRFDPGSKAAYSNLGYLILAEVISQLTGRPFEETVRLRLLEPLGMRRTGFSVDPDESWATPYQRRRTPRSVVMSALVPRRIIGPNEGRFRSLNHFYVDGAGYGGLLGPATDAARFLRAHLGDGELDGTRILSVQSAQAMRTIAAKGRKLEVGLGWFRRARTPDANYVEHLGGGAGFWNCMRIYPEQDIGVVVMGNATSYDHDAVASAAVALARGR